MKGLARARELPKIKHCFLTTKTKVCVWDVYLPVLGEMVEEGEDVAHDYENGARPGLHQVAHLQHELVLRLQL
jgi:hypothetical protein